MALTYQSPLAFGFLENGAAAHGLGDRARPRAPSGAPCAGHVVPPPALGRRFFPIASRGRAAVHLRVGALPESTRN